MLGIILLVCKYIFNNFSAKNILLVFSVDCFIPLQLMRESGWVATTTNYHWPAVLALLAFYPFYQCLRKERISLPIYIVGLLSLFYAANQEQVNLCFFVFTIIISVYLYRHKRYEHKLIWYSLLSFFELIFSMTTPGNWIRFQTETARWFPKYGQFNFINKLDLDISSFGKAFFLNISLLFLLVFLLTAILVYKQKRNYYVTILSAIPRCFNLIIYLGGTIHLNTTNFGDPTRVMIWSTAHIDKIFTKNGTNLSLFYPSTWIATLLILGLLFCLVLGLYFSFSNTYNGSFAALLLLMAFCSLVLMGFSPTVWASGMRTYYIVYISMLLLVLMLFKQLKILIEPARINIFEFILTTTSICTFILAVLVRK